MGTRVVSAGITAAFFLPVLVFPQADPTPAEELLVVVKNAEYGYINHDGAVVIPPQFLWGTDFIDGLAAV